MNDRFNRKIDYMRISVTDLCNLRCKYCMPACGVQKAAHEDILSIEEIAEIVRAGAACGIRKVRITGGEPLVRRGIVDICKRVREIPGIEELCLTTNGTLLPTFAQPLRDAGVDRMNLSLDTLRPDRYRDITRRGNLDDFWAGLAAGKAAGFEHFKINTVLMGGFNDDEIPDFVAMTRDRDLEIRFIELMPIGESSSWGKGSFIPNTRVLEAVPELEPVESAGVASRYKLPGARGTVGLISPLSRHFCPDCNRIRVTADGRLKPCLHSNEEIPLRGLHGEDLVHVIAEGIGQKPERHSLAPDHPSEARRNMNQIGG